MAEETKTEEKKERKPRKKKVETTETQKDEVKETKKRKKKIAAVVARGKRKESVARATITSGKGNIRINHLKLDAYYSNKYVREIVKQPLAYLGTETSDIDIKVNVYGVG